MSTLNILKSPGRPFIKSPWTQEKNKRATSNNFILCLICIGLYLNPIVNCKVYICSKSIFTISLLFCQLMLCKFLTFQNDNKKLLFYFILNITNMNLYIFSINFLIFTLTCRVLFWKRYNYWHSSIGFKISYLSFGKW